MGGKNYAFIPATGQPVTKANLFAASDVTEATLPANGTTKGYLTGTQGVAEFEYLAMTVPMACVIPVTPSQPVEIKIALADSGDADYNTAVFLRAGSLAIAPNKANYSASIPKDATYAQGEAAAPLVGGFGMPSEWTGVGYVRVVVHQWYVNDTASNTGGTPIPGTTTMYSTLPPRRRRLRQDVLHPAHRHRGHQILLLLHHHE